MMDPAAQDIHILRYFSSSVSVSDGRVINITDPSLSFCPLAGHLYRGFREIDGGDKEAVKQEIRRAIESKIRDFGFFTGRRQLSREDSAIPYGASEMLMHALRKRTIDAAVVVCDGAGTVVTDRADVVQGIGARMNTLLLTSPIARTVARLKELGCRVVFDNALIDQVKGVEEAIQSGHKRVAVTVAGWDAARLPSIRRLESESGACVTVLGVCTTGISAEKADEMVCYADMVWSCASGLMRRKAGGKALLQISRQIPVFVLSEKGVELAASSADDGALLRGLDRAKQYLISHGPGSRRIKLGKFTCSICEGKLPVPAGSEP